MDASPLEIRDALVGYFHNNYSGVPDEYPNVQLDDASKKSTWVAFDIRFTSSETIIKGSTGTITRHRGVIFLEIYVQPLTGNRKSYEIATDLCNIMERKRIGGVVTRNAILNEMRLADNLSVLIVEIPFLSS